MINHIEYILLFKIKLMDVTFAWENYLIILILCVFISFRHQNCFESPKMQLEPIIEKCNILFLRPVICLITTFRKLFNSFRRMNVISQGETI